MSLNTYDYTIFYKIYCKDTALTDIYIGHTTDFSQRIIAHKSKCKSEKHKYKHSNVYPYIQNNGGWDNWNMDIIDILSCSNSSEARKKELEFIVLHNATLNKAKPSITRKETTALYRNSNREKYLSKVKFIILKIKQN